MKSDDNVYVIFINLLYDWIWEYGNQEFPFMQDHQQP